MAEVVRGDEGRDGVDLGLLDPGQDYVEQGIDAYEKRRLNRKFAHLDRQARKLGLQLVPALQNQPTQNQIPSKA